MYREKDRQREREERERMKRYAYMLRHMQCNRYIIYI